MAVRAYYVEELALRQLETALRLYFEGTDFASVVTIGGHRGRNIRKVS
jgi:hypothetical protein